jgi:hypothetical protein
MTGRFSLRWLLPSLVPLTLVPTLRADDGKGLEFFEKRVRPVLAANCYECHSTAAQAGKKLRGGLFLDSKDGMLKGGDSGPAIVPGKPKQGLLLETLRQAGEVKMPPKGKLPDSIIADLETWIAMGAPDPRVAAVVRQRGLSIEEGRRFWSFLPVERPAVPEFKAPKSGRENEIDAFIGAKLRDKGLEFAPEAEPAVLIRRLSYDLTGLPPSPEEVEAFVQTYRGDPQKAYGALVERLLASPHFGERWGRHWLDLVRYAESLTLRGFVMKEAWRYRDYVIANFNQDVPYDRFLREQVAGDLLPADSLEQRRRQLTALTFLSLGNTNLEQQDKKQLVMDVVDEQLDVISKAILAQTVTCARCHDHKFDPIPTKDYYALAGILRNTRTLTHANVSKWLEAPLPAEPDKEKLFKERDAAVAALTREITELKAVIAKARPANPAKPSVHAVKDLQGIVVDDAQAKKVGEWKASKYSGAYVGDGYVHDDGKGKGEKTITFQPDIPKTGKYEVRLAYSAGTNRATNVPVTIFCAEGEKTVHVDQKKAPEIDGLFHALGQFKFERNSQGFVIIANEETNGVVIADAVVFIPVEKLGELNEARPPLDAKDTVLLRSQTAQLKGLEGKLKKLQESGPPRDMVMTVQEESAIEDCKIHVRGNVHNQSELAARGFLQVTMTGPAPRLPADESGRRQLGDWLAAKDNPLTARVFANRAWHWLFGTGIVRTTDNFGVTGEKPSHSELLDYLAIRFMDDGWSTKKLVRQIVMSRTYRQSARGSSPKSQREDPENRWLSHQNRRRLDAECIRDTILAVSGQLKLDAGGRTFGELNSDYNFKQVDTRLSVNLPVFRNSLPEIFEAFDFADPSVCNGRRNVSTVAPQALFLMNNPFVSEQAGHAAKRLLAENGLDDAGRVAKAFQLALGRAPSLAERKLSENYLGELSADSAVREQQWMRFMQALFGSLDFRYVE